MRQIVLDTETTGLDPALGHKIIEIGCVELINRKLTGNNYHQYIKPDREIDEGAQRVHGLSQKFLEDKPLFADIVDDLLGYINNAELIIHNAPFDIGFLNNELKITGKEKGVMADYCTVIDTLVLARKIHPGQKNNLDALCKRYEVNNTQRDLHGALLDSELLAEVYLNMTGGQVHMDLNAEETELKNTNQHKLKKISDSRPKLPVIVANEQELVEHEKFLQLLNKAGR